MTASNTQRIAIVLFLLVTAVTLVFGLKPQGSFQTEWATADSKTGKVEFGEYGYLQGDFPEFASPIQDNSSLEFVLTLTARTQLDPNFRIILFIGNDCESNPMIIGQWRSQLIVMQGCDFPNVSQQPRLSTTLDGHTGVPTEITLVLAKHSSQLKLNDTVVSSQSVKVVDPSLTEGSMLLIGNSANGRNGWTGSIEQFAIQRTYQDDTPTEEANKRTASETAKDTTSKIEVLQRYSFSNLRDTNTFTNDELGSNDNLDKNLEPDNKDSSEHQKLIIPAVGKFPNAIVLERYSINRLLENEKTDLLLNFFGFAPFGVVTAMCLYCLLGFRGIKLIVLSFFAATVVSLGIELSQVYIAGRRSALHDLILNSTGSIPGALSFVVAAALYRFRHKLSFMLPKR